MFHRRMKDEASAMYFMLRKSGSESFELYIPWLPQSATSFSRKSISSCKLGVMVTPYPLIEERKLNRAEEVEGEEAGLTRNEISGAKSVIRTRVTWIWELPLCHMMKIWWPEFVAWKSRR